MLREKKVIEDTLIHLKIRVINILVILLVVTLLVGCKEKNNEYDFLESVAYDIYVMNDSETEVCDNYNHYFETKIADKCDNVYLIFTSVRDLVSDPLDIVIDEEDEYDVKISMRTNDGGRIELTFKKKLDRELEESK